MGILQLFSGPVAESLPTSISAYHPRRARADSTTSFTYYQDEDDDEEPEMSPLQADFGHRGSISDIEDMRFGEEDDDSVDVEEGRIRDEYILRRRSSTYSRSSVRDRLLLRTDSARTAASGRAEGRQSQKVYMINEDLTIAIAGFRTSTAGYVLYCLLCLCTLGSSWLLLRWLPRWQVRLLGKPCALATCSWVVIEVRP